MLIHGKCSDRLKEEALLINLDMNKANQDRQSNEFQYCEVRLY